MLHSRVGADLYGDLVEEKIREAGVASLRRRPRTGHLLAGGSSSSKAASFAAISGERNESISVTVHRSLISRWLCSHQYVRPSGTAAPHGEPGVAHGGHVSSFWRWRFCPARLATRQLGVQLPLAL